jgi:hypothetical protein
MASYRTRYLVRCIQCSVCGIKVNLWVHNTVQWLFDLPSTSSEVICITPTWTHRIVIVESSVNALYGVLVNVWKSYLQSFLKYGGCIKRWCMRAIILVVESDRVWLFRIEEYHLSALFSSKKSFPFWFSEQHFYVLLAPPKPAACPSDPILLDLIILIMSGQGCKS